MAIMRKSFMPNGVMPIGIMYNGIMSSNVFSKIKNFEKTQQFHKNI